MRSDSLSTFLFPKLKTSDKIPSKEDKNLVIVGVRINVQNWVLLFRVVINPELD
ncbi:MAG TPA: hypothetical protein VI146_02970 [Nitrososphaeraceae archaeon]